MYILRETPRDFEHILKTFAKARSNHQQEAMVNSTMSQPVESFSGNLI